MILLNMLFTLALASSVNSVLQLKNECHVLMTYPGYDWPKQSCMIPQVMVLCTLKATCINVVVMSVMLMDWGHVVVPRDFI